MPKTAAPFPFARLTVISGAIFVCVSSEFLPTGILPDIAAGLRVSEAQAGLLVSVFAFTVVVSTVPLTRLTQRYSRKWLMVTVLAIFAVTNVVCALAPDYWTMLTGRILGGLAHGVFWAVTAPYAARLVKPSQIVRATSVTNAGGTLAFILGVPMGAAIGHALGWRLAFVVMAVLVVVFAILVVLFLPPVEHRVTLKTGEIALPARKDPTIGIVVLVCVIVALVFMGQNTLSTYVAPWLLQVPRFDDDLIASILMIGGISGAVGLVIAGVVGDRDPHRMLFGFIATAILAIAALALLGPLGWPALGPYLVWNVAVSVLPPLTQGLMMRDVSPRLRDMAAASLTTSFNLAIGGGALVGAGVVAWLGVPALPWFMIGFLALALVFVVIEAWRKQRRSARRPLAPEPVA